MTRLQLRAVYFYQISLKYPLTMKKLTVKNITQPKIIISQSGVYRQINSLLNFSNGNLELLCATGK